MHVSKLRVKNYRNFGDPAFEIELKPFTLILGENNVGKTNLLSALGLILSQELIMFKRRVLELDDINYEAVQAFKRQVLDPDIRPEDVSFPEVLVEASFADMDADQEAVVGDWFVDQGLTEAVLTYSFGPRGNSDRRKWVDEQKTALKQAQSKGHTSESELLELIDFPIKEYRYAIYGGRDPSKTCDWYLLRMLRMEFLDALRDAQTELVASGEYRLLYRVLSHAGESEYEDIKASLSALRVAVGKNAKLKKLREDVEALLGRVSLQAEEAENKVDFLFTRPETAEVLKKIGLTYGTKPISVARNGLGRNNLLYICLVLSELSGSDSRGRDVKFRLVGVEEPEAHLHPHLQDHLAANIEQLREASSGRMQLLLTSHSTHIAAKLNLDNTVVMYEETGTGRVGSHYVLSGMDPSGDRRTIHYLRKYVDATKSRMFFARKLILVEGITEQLLVPKLFELHSMSTLDREGCTVVNVRGVSFRHFLKIVQKGYFIRCAVLTDRDSELCGDGRASGLKEEFDQQGLILVEISENGTFEKDLVRANAEGEGKCTLLHALEETRPRKGGALSGTPAGTPLDPEDFFDMVKGCKSEFAFNLAARLGVEAEGFGVPPYMRRAFDFVRGGQCAARRRSLSW